MSNIMKVILMEDVPKLGNKYDVKNVSGGYARNFLLPRKMVQLASDKAVKAIEELKKQHTQELEVRHDILEKNINSLDGIKVSVEEKANEKGHLFSIIHPGEISKILKTKNHIDIPAKLIEIETEKPIKAIGEHKIKVKDKEFTLEVLALKS